ncbi:cardiolipin synthase [Sediminicoccus sp. KRV36]|uniref:cardiolipin synthase n=1 Tax=Sediminicoccus sp. KRV36 TaxID=3133721 RepID=UPI00200E9CBE|nr:cardiolipin synthase [Sediminicoccus rosea]UPY38643.1 cardiolipin synthase [Sediminicoccus rosea]
MILALHLAAQCAVIIRVLLRPHRDPASRVAWVVLALAVPVVGMLAYLVLGETNIGRRRAARMQRVLAELPEAARMGLAEGAAAPAIPERLEGLFRVGQSISGYGPVGGNTARLIGDSNASITAIVADIDAATRHVHLLFYIWLPDGNGLRVAEALKRAAARGVACRAVADDIGSRAMIRSPHWAAMAAAGVRLARALPLGFPILRTLDGRIDLRNHRKIIVIDNRITWCGSQNCADPEFLPKAKFAPWVDAVMRFEGPIARQNQHLFASDWMSWGDDDLRDILLEPPGPDAAGGIIAQVVASGPTERHSAMPEMFQSLIYAARRELVISTPYYVPDEAMQAALRAAGNRGVATSIIFPARNDNFAVAAASQSYYADLLEAGVRIHEYQGGLLHTKSLTLDGEVTLIGSANMDRRSFDLNYENNILLYDAEATAAMRALQESYIARSRPVLPADVAAWPWHRQLRNNIASVLSPVL